jgi:hypothetical protein
MKLLCCVTMDVEIDKDIHYRIGQQVSFKNVIEAIPNLLEPLFIENGVKPTYLLSAEVIQNQDCLKILKKLKSDHELGTHGHAEFLKDGMDVLKSGGILLREFINDYTFDEQLSKLTWLTELFYSTFGYEPKSFRGGRFGVNGDTIKALEQLDYRVESSVTPGTFWDSDREILNFVDAPEQPYCPATDDITAIGNSALLEVPVSCWPAHSLAKYIQKYLVHCCSKGQPLPFLFTRVLKKTLASLHWLRPTKKNPRVLRNWIEDYIQRHRHRSVVVINIMFHPIEVVVGASPYAVTTAQVNRIMVNLRAMLSFLKEKEADFVTLDQVAQYYPPC